MQTSDFFDRVKLLNLPELRERRPGWTDRLPLLPERPLRVTMHLVRRHWSFWLPASVREAYMLWLTRRRYRLNLEQIETDELDDLCALDVDSSENVKAVYEKHAIRRMAARFLVVTRA